MTLTKEEFFEKFPLDQKEQAFFNTVGLRMTDAEYYKAIREYLIKHKKNDFKGLKIKYGPSTNNPDGRLYVKDKIGLQRIHNSLKSFLVQNIYTDIDMKNAHPTILNKMCLDEGLPNTHQENYVKNRAALLEEAKTDKHSMLIKLYCDDKLVKTKDGKRHWNMSLIPQKSSKTLHEICREWNTAKKFFFCDRCETCSFRREGT